MFAIFHFLGSVKNMVVSLEKNIFLNNVSVNAPKS